MVCAGVYALLLNSISKRKLSHLQSWLPIRFAQESAGNLVLGAHVRLVGLSQAHFNGLEGYVTGGPNEKGRFTVDVIVDDDEMVREMQTLSFKAENLLVLPPEHASNQPGRGPSSYRGGA